MRLSTVYLSSLLVLALPGLAEAQVSCGPDGTDRTLPAGSTVLNAYYPGPAVSGLVTVAAGATSIPSDLASVRGMGTIAAGDLLMVIQMQGATIDGTNQDTVGGSYGDGAGGLDRMGVVAGPTFIAGTYELVVAAGAPTAGAIPLSTALVNSYAHSSTIVDTTPTGIGFRRYQVVRVAEHRNLTIPATATATALPWDGNSGGILAIDVAGTLTLNGAIDVSGMGFRGGSPIIPTAVDSPSRAIKGESIAGPTSRMYGLPVTTGTTLTVYTGATGLFGGDTGRGAPGNGGGTPSFGGTGLGDGNDSGGGGGGGGGVGGVGSIGPVAGTAATIPRGGAGFTNPARLFLGGGGGSGSLDDPTSLNAVSGQPGGGIVYVRAVTITGTGRISSDGRGGFSQPQEGGGGGGAGGSVFLYTATTNLTGLTLRALGGAGTATMLADDGGGGGGGGGHFVLATPTGSATATVTVTGGAGGTSPTAGASGGVGVGGFQQIALPPTTATCPAPDTTIATQPTSPTNDPTADFTFTATIAGSTFECSVDGGPFTACTTPFATAALADGMHILRVRARAPDGAIDPTPASATWVLDTTAPDTTIVTFEPNPTSDPTGDFTFSSPDATATFECSVDGGAFAACPATFSTASLADGPHTLSVRARDAAGNVDPTPATYAWTVSTTPPDTTIATFEPNPTSDPTGDFTFSATVSGSTFECSVDGGAFAACPATFSTAPLGDAMHILRVRAISPSGVVDPTPATYTWIVDTAAPDTTIVTAEPNPTADPTGDFTFSSSEAVATFECSVDGGAFAACPATFSTTALANGPHTLSVRAIDAAGNVDPTPAMYAWVVDTTEPETTIATAEPNPTNDPTGDFTFTASIAGSTFECSVDGGAFTACPATFSTAALSDGPHTLSVRAISPAGAIDSTPATHTWTVDTAAPDTSIVTSEPDPTMDPTGDFVFASTDPAATFECSIDGGAFVACPATFSTDALAVGDHTLAVRAVDAAGNVDPTPATYGWTVEMPANFVSIEAPADGSATTDTTPTLSGRGEPGSTVSVTVDGVVVGTATVAADGTWSVTPTAPLTEGSHTAVATSTNLAGLVATATSTFDVDAGTVVDYRQPADASTVGTPRPELSGTSEPGNTIAITLDGALVATVTADAEGNWSFVVAADLADGDHSVSVLATDDAGNTATDAGDFTVVALDPFVEIRSPVDQSTTSDTTPTITGVTDPGLSVRVLVDGVVIGLVMADDDGFWSVTVPSALSAARHTVVADVTNAAGDRATDTHEFTVEASAPSVAITAPINGVSTPDTTPPISGTATPGATIEVFVDGALIGTATAAADGTWSVTPTAPLAEGPHSVRATATAAGNSATDGSGFVVDTSTFVAITTPAEGATTPVRPIFVGTAEAGASVEVLVDGTVIGTVVAAGDGTWSLAAPSDLSAGPHSVTANATDEVGNTATDSSAFLVDPTVLDTDGDGLLDTDECPSMPCRDTDGDGDPDFDDVDDDGDGVPTRDEAPGGTPRDTDGDGTPDHLDVDDDGDGIPTADEAPGGVTRDTDLDGVLDHLDVDDDGDGIPTSEEAPAGDRVDTDGDGRPNFIDPDDDDDTIATARERADGLTAGTDVDGDGLPNHLDVDSDGVMGGDEMEGTGDADGDGTPDYLDPDEAPDGGVADAGPVDGGVVDGSVADGSVADGSIVSTPGGLSGGACGCRAAGRGQGGEGLALLSLIALSLLARRRR